jgi:hypothetical protein
MAYQALSDLSSTFYNLIKIKIKKIIKKSDINQIVFYYKKLISNLLLIQIKENLYKINYYFIRLISKRK